MVVGPRSLDSGTYKVVYLSHHDVYSYMSKVVNWHGVECIKVKDIDSDMARQHGRQKSQAPTQVFKLRTS